MYLIFHLAKAIYPSSNASHTLRLVIYLEAVVTFSLYQAAAVVSCFSMTVLLSRTSAFQDTVEAFLKMENSEQMELLEQMTSKR